MCLALTFIILSWVHMPDRQQCVSSLQCLLLFVHIRPLFNFADKRSVSVMDRTTYWYIFCVCFRIWHLAWSLSGSHCWLKVVTSICTCFTPHIHHSVSVLRMTKTPIPAILCWVVLSEERDQLLSCKPVTGLLDPILWISTESWCVLGWVSLSGNAGESVV